MKKILPYSIIVLIVIFSLFHRCEGREIAEEKPQLTFDGRVWGIASQAQNHQGSIIEYVLGGETVNNWTELVTIQTFKGIQENTTVQNLMEKTKENLKAQCPDLKWNVIRKKDDDVLYEWSITNCPADKDRHEIARIISGKKGIHIIRYVTKKMPILAKVRKQWIKLIGSATLDTLSLDKKNRVENNVIPPSKADGLFYSTS